MENFLCILIAIIGTLIATIVADELKDFCTKFCICDLYQDLNRADCRNQNLIGADINIPSEVEILDLSRNSITTLDNRCFHDLTILINLTLSYNSIHTIYLDAFKGLENMRSVDLSYNRLEYFDPRIFESNLKLISINLSGNKFMSLKNQPIAISKSILQIDMNNTQISHIYPVLFEEMPNLTKIDISNNLLITLPISAFQNLRKLKYLNTSGNRWKCDKNLEVVIMVLRKRKINVDSDCKIKQLKGDMFERLVEMPKPNSNSIRDKTSTSANIQVLWKKKELHDKNMTEIQDCDLYDVNAICALYNNCINNYSKLLKNQNPEVKPCLTANNDELSKHGFYGGIMLGSITTVVTLYLIWLIYQCICVGRSVKIGSNSARNASIPIDIPVPQTSDNLLVQNSIRPRRVRQRTRPRRNNFKMFISNLFARPARHRYYRTVNRNTANIIRRLSQSNIFSNTLRSQQLNANQNSRNSDEAVRLINAELPSNPSRSTELATLTVSTIDVSHPNTSSVRPETPPPAYTDI